MINVGVIGAGSWGIKLLMELRDLANVTMVSNKYNVENVNKLFPGIRTTLDYKEILSDPSVAAVVIATPIVDLASIAMESLQAGKHVFVEKPLGVTFAEVDRLVSSYYYTYFPRQILFAGYINSYSPISDYIKVILLTDPAVRVVIDWAKYGTFKNDLLLNLASHDIFLCLDLVGSYIDQVNVIYITPDTCMLHLVFATCSSQIVIDRRCKAPSHYIRIETLKGRILTWNGNSLTDSFEEDASNYFCVCPNLIRSELMLFLQSIESGRNRSVNLITAVNVHKVIDVIRAST